MAESGIWYEGKAFTPGVEPSEVVKFEGEGAKQEATLWFAQRRESGVCDSVYVVEVKGEARETVLSWADTYLWYCGDKGADGDTDEDYDNDYYDEDDVPDEFLEDEEYEG